MAAPAGSRLILLMSASLDVLVVTHVLGVLFMSMSLDGFVAGPNESVDNGLGDHIELEPVRVLEGSGVTHLRYRVRH
jgi:hypothetical protein